ncbi:PQQ-binding-like beta-propeller repeat protein [Streptomyces caniscabiei]|nr:PQQ-binding-like beta-propeller repeat protein [Streptomyces caniscabiei]MDX2603637.1 PQQ-binding-like beta-propeller repeat protein [Streptomyces caniscabiei]MDX2738831.1 PQQ-binding-like beta-propeller repeat protein [Streptomyces caniscabiei]MDX2779629.1 PQQ-binding-like beta-propeller repeat protein [Streptomyces caniscabiei]
MEPLGSDDPEELGPYRLVARLGAGGMGRVYLARSPQGRTAAVKAIRPELMGDKNFRIRFRREVEAAGAVGGRYTAPVVDADPEAPIPWLATDYIAGPTLAEAVAAHGPLPVESVLVLGAGIAEALISVQAAGLVHRDLKPSNVLLAADGPRVIDFGIVRASDGYDLTRSGALFGSFEYMCPEQATGEPLGPEGDIFSLGSVLTFAASGHAPFSGNAAATLLYQVVHSMPDLTGVPEPLDKIINLCLTKDPRLRITPDKLAAACAPGGVEQPAADGWLPPSVASSIALRAAAVQTLDSGPDGPVVLRSTEPVRERDAYDFQRERLAQAPGPERAAQDARRDRAAYDFEVEGAPAATGTSPVSGCGGPYDGSGSPGRAAGAPPVDRDGGYGRADTIGGYGEGGPYAGSGRYGEDGGAGRTGGESSSSAASSADADPCPAPGDPEPYRASGHRRAVPRPGPSRRTVLTLSAGSAAAAVGAGLVLSRREKPGVRSTEPAGPAPKPLWTYRGGPLLQAPAVFNDGTALVKTRPGDLLCLDLKDGTRPRWVYQGISQSPTPAVLAFDAVIALGEGSTVIGVDPVDGTERFTIDFGPDFRFTTLLGGVDDRAVSVIGVRLRRESDEQGVATSTDTVFGVDLAARRAEVIPISPEDVGVKLAPVILPGYFVYADGLRNVTVRDTDSSGVLWRHPVGYDLRPGLAVVNRTVFAIGQELKALDLNDGKLRWRVKPERGMFASLGGYGNTVYVTGTDPAGVYAFNAGTGARRWFCPTPRLNIDQPITAGPSAVYVTAYKNKNGFYAIDAAKGGLLWNFTDGLETGVNDWQLACDHGGVLVAQHYDRTYGLPSP